MLCSALGLKNLLSFPAIENKNDQKKKDKSHKNQVKSCEPCFHFNLVHCALKKVILWRCL